MGLMGFYSTSGKWRSSKERVNPYRRWRVGELACEGLIWFLEIKNDKCDTQLKMYNNANIYLSMCLFFQTISIQGALMPNVKLYRCYHCA